MGCMLGSVPECTGKRRQIGSLETDRKESAIATQTRSKQGM
jgi:hypothetical protein